MKFLLKIFVFMAIILISKFTSIEPAGRAVQVNTRQPKAALVNYLHQGDSAALKQHKQQTQLAEIYN